MKRDPAVIARMQRLFDLYETSLEIMRQNLRRRHPQASEAEIERRLVTWLRARPHEQWKAAETSPRESPGPER